MPVPPHPTPLVTARPAQTSEMNASAVRLMRAALAGGWTMRCTYAKGYDLTANGSVGPLRESVLLMVRRGRTVLAAHWRDKKFEHAYRFGDVYLTRLSSAEFKAQLTVEPATTTTIHPDSKENPMPPTYVACEFCGEMTMRWFIVNASPTVLRRGDLAELHGRLCRGESLRNGVHGECDSYPGVFAACHVCALESWECGSTVEDWGHPEVAAAFMRLGDPAKLGGFTAGADAWTTRSNADTHR